MKLRRAAVHKAQPIKHYKPMEVSCLILLSLDYSGGIIINSLRVIFWGIIITADNYFSKVKPSTKPLTQPEPPQLQVSNYINYYLTKKILMISQYRTFLENLQCLNHRQERRGPMRHSISENTTIWLYTHGGQLTIVSHSEAQFNRVYCVQINLCLFLSELRWY